MTTRVMIVDDDPTLVRLCRLVLEREGFQVLGAFNAPQCLEALGKNEVDLIVLDLPLDDSWGWDLLSTIEHHDRWKGIPVVVISSIARDCVGEWGTKPVAGYLRKPFQIEHLLREVRDSLVPV